jgi:hypothetical protein
MSFHRIAFAGAICLMVLGCATKSTNDSRLWRVQKERQQQVAREAGRIGYIGNEGPALGTSIPSSSM